jgi:hypothetical protein
LEYLDGASQYVAMKNRKSLILSLVAIPFLGAALAGCTAAIEPDPVSSLVLETGNDGAA